MDYFNRFNFVIISHRVTFHLELHMSLEQPALVMTNPLRGVCPITMKETLYRIISHYLCLQFHNAFATHFSSHQFKITTKGNCEIIIYGIKCTLRLHPNWVIQLDVANAFNLVLRRVIFQKLRVTNGNIIQLILFVHAFYAFEPPLFYNHCNCESDFIAIPSAMGT